MGVSDTVWSDQGPQFTSKVFQDFAVQWGFRHATSSPGYPQINRKAEATVKSMKKLLQAAWTGRHLDKDRLTRGLLQYRNTPSRKDGSSPAQKLYGKPIQDALPAHRRSFVSSEAELQPTCQTTPRYHRWHKSCNPRPVHQTMGHLWHRY